MSKTDVKFYFKKNSKYYFSFFAVLVFSVAISVVIMLGSDSYLELIVSKNKVLFSFISGGAKLSSVFWGRISSSLFLFLLIFVLGLNYYLSILSYLVVGYQFVIFLLTIYAVINVFYFSGALVCLLILIPLNLLFFLSLIFFSVTCIERSHEAERQKYFKFGFDAIFFSKLAVSLAVNFVLSFFVSYVLPLVLKSAVFTIY